jgi:Cu(I)/Ag(I) efflux system membrane fusion protein
MSETTNEQAPTADEAPRGWRVMGLIRWIIVVVMAVAATAAVLSYFGAFHESSATSGKTLYYCPMHPSVVQDHPGECPICSMTLVEKPAGGAPAKPSMPLPAAATSGAAKKGRYYCPMHPEETSDDPNARCPKCGMKMELRPTSGAPAMPMPTAAPAPVPGLSPVDLTPERIQLLGMRTAVVKRASLAPELRTVGYVGANEEGLAKVNTRFSGWVEHLYVDQTGQRVSRGQPLASIYSPDLLAAEEEYLNARRWSGEHGGTSDAEKLSAGLADDARRRLELFGIAPSDIDALANTGKPVRALTLRSPVDGYVTTKNVVQGVYVQPGTELFEISDLSTVWVLADIYEYEVERIHVGEKATLQLTAYPGQSFPGRVQFLYPTLDESSRTMKLRLAFKNAGLRLRPGMYGTVTVTLGRAEGLVIPRDALVDTGEEQYVFVAQSAGHFEPRRVQTGLRSGSDVQILDGVREGETVVTTANFLIDSESRLRAAIEGSTKSSAEEVPIDKDKYPDKYQQWKQCEIQHRGMGTMEEDCKNAIPKPWR